MGILRVSSLWIPSPGAYSLYILATSLFIFGFPSPVPRSPRPWGCPYGALSSLPHNIDRVYEKSATWWYEWDSSKLSESHFWSKSHHFPSIHQSRLAGAEFNVSYDEFWIQPLLVPDGKSRVSYSRLDQSVSIIELDLSWTSFPCMYLNFQNLFRVFLGYLVLPQTHSPPGLLCGVALAVWRNEERVRHKWSEIIGIVAVQCRTAGPKLHSGHVPLRYGPIPSRIDMLWWYSI